MTIFDHTEDLRKMSFVNLVNIFNSLFSIRSRSSLRLSSQMKRQRQVTRQMVVKRSGTMTMVTTPVFESPLILQPFKQSTMSKLNKVK